MHRGVVEERAGSKSGTIGKKGGESGLWGRKEERSGDITLTLTL